MALAFTAAMAMPQSPLTATKLDKPPTIDGKIDDSEWHSVTPLIGLKDPNTGAPYPDSAKFWIAYDKNYVYFAAKMTESEPGKIRANEYRTNVDLSGDDYVELDLDLSGSLSAFNTFQINPLGATHISIAGGRAAKREWLGEFLAKGRVTPDGWEAEARIPWRAMNIPRGGRHDIRFNILRFIAKNQRTLAQTFVPPLQTALTPTWQSVDLPKPEVDHSIKLLPYLYTGYDPSTGGVYNGGLDMKTNLTDQVTMVGSINPDFRNIENSILSLDFSRFERIADETRPFFQEGHQYSNSQLFISQRIHQFDAGINTYGRLNDKTSFSTIATAQFGNESDTVINVSHDPTPDTSLRVTTTDLEQPGLSNRSNLFRYSQNFGAFNLFARHMDSQDTTLGEGVQNDAYLTYSRSGFTSTTGWAFASKNFKPRLGFVSEVDLKGFGSFNDFTRNFDHGPLSDMDVQASITAYDHADGSFYRNEQFYQASATLRGGLNLSLGIDQANFEGSKDSLYTYAATYPRGNPYNNVRIQYDQGMQAGLPYHSITGTTSYLPNKKLQFTLREQHVDYDVASDQTIFTTAWDLGKDRSIASRFVRQDNNFNAYLAYQRSGNQGTEYYFILGDPNALTYRNALTLKLVVPVSLGKPRK
ncbi:MAG: hypothetical protein JST12_17585 [Armatimonadetes bacterium]|nr:hypothetical protein [Armatimonadota bacterium]